MDDAYSGREQTDYSACRSTSVWDGVSIVNVLTWASMVVLMEVSTPLCF